MQSTEPEIWKPVVGYEGIYEVSDQGRVRSLDRVYMRAGHPIRHKGRMLSPAASDGGYLRVDFNRGGRRQTRTVHSVVAEAFIGVKPAGLEVLHRNGQRLDVRASNLRYGSRSENILDLVRHGVHNNARKTHCKRGHEFTNENTIPRARGWRECRECARTRQREWESRKRKDQN